MTGTHLPVRYRTTGHIEFAAQRLLCEYCRAIEPIVAPPIPIEEVLERLLRLNLVFDNLRTVVGVEGVLGALCVDQREVLIDQSLDPEEYPDLEGRYRFTLAHEIGHWQLHRSIYRRLLKTERPLLATWEATQNRRLERQADIFAACILMPRPFVYRLWREVLGGRVIARSQLRADIRALAASESLAEGGVADPELTDNYLVEMEVAALADEFRVSSIAMRIRLEQLGLVVS